MANFAVYDVVADDNTPLNATPGDAVNNQHDFELDFASSVKFDIRSVLSYMVDPSSSGVTFEMYVSNLLSNGSEDFKKIVSSTTLPSQHAFMRQEVISANTFAKVNGSGLGVHKLRIKVNNGAANFSDIVHMYLAST